MAAHLFIVHYPLALLTLGAVLDAGGAMTRSRTTRRGAGYLLILGAVAALVSFFTGQGALDAALLSRSLTSPDAAALHTQWGGAGVWGIAIAGALRAMWRERLEGAHGWLNLALAVGSALLVVAIGHTGSAIQHAG